MNGIPPLDHPGHWPIGALGFANSSLTSMGFGCRLCDFVNWACTQDLLSTSTNADVEFSEARFAERGEFGMRLPCQDDLARLDRRVIWKRTDGSYLSPLWEYSALQRGTLEGFEEKANFLGSIGQGIDAAVLARSPTVEPVDAHRVHAAVSFVFGAGEALTRLRFKMELEDIFRSGVGVERAAKLGGDIGSDRSRVNKRKRMRQMVAKMEVILKAKPTASENAYQLVLEAVFLSAESDPGLWSQGGARGMH